jgi:hypothetical protein
MAVFIGSTAVLILVVFAAGYRKVALGLAAFALVVGGLLYMHNRAEEQRSLTRIPKSELVLENVTLKPYVGSYRIAGRITNNSPKFSVKQIDIVVAVRDCPRDAAAQQCVTIGESSAILNLDIPPGEARNFEEAVRFSGKTPKLKSRLDWNYSISGIRAE